MAGPARLLRASAHPGGIGAPNQPGRNGLLGECLACAGKGAGEPNDPFVGGIGSLPGDEPTSGVSGLSPRFLRPSNIF
jgi:hypothetical protein